TDGALPGLTVGAQALRWPGGRSSVLPVRPGHASFMYSSTLIMTHSASSSLMPAFFICSLDALRAWLYVGFLPASRNPLASAACRAETAWCGDVSSAMHGAVFVSYLGQGPPLRLVPRGCWKKAFCMTWCDSLPVLPPVFFCWSLCGR